MADFKITDDMFDEKPRSNDTYLPIGVHKVKIMLVEPGKWDSGDKFVELTVADEDERIARQRLTFNEQKGARSVNVLSGIFIHNTAKDKRDQMRSALKALGSVDKLIALAQEKLIGKEAWVDVVPRRDSKYPMNFITGYEPTHWDPDGTGSVQKVFKGAKNVSETEVPDGF